MLVVGATAPDQLRCVRDLVGNMNILVPGIGTQGGDIEAVLQAGLTVEKSGLLINVSRAIIFDDNPAEKGNYFRDLINQYR